MRRLRIALATMAITVTMAQIAAAAGPGATTSASAPATTTTTTTSTTSTTTSTTTTPSTTTTAPTTGVTVAPTTTTTTAPKPPKPPHAAGGKGGKGGGSAPETSNEGDTKQGGKGSADVTKGQNGAINAPSLSGITAPVIPSVSCSTVGAPVELLPIYQHASDAYGLGPQGPAILASINGIESGFGANLGPSSAGAEGWMQFMPSTWASYGVDADGDGTADPNDPHDAIFAAASYLSAAGMPADTAGAIFAYKHADWYVAEVLANAGCYGSGSTDGTYSLAPGMPLVSCTPAKGEDIDKRYMNAFEQAASRYDLGQRGVWALAGVASLESNFGHAMGKAELAKTGPLGIDGDEWNRFEIDGNNDGLIDRSSIEDSAATLAREIWSRGDLRSGLFLHNQASWYVDQVIGQADEMTGKCVQRSVEWNVALPTPTSANINWANLTLSNSLEMHDIRGGLLDPRIMGLLGMITQTHKITISALRSDHSQMTVDGNVSNHYFGRAMDIAAVDGVSCTDVSPSAPCAQLGRTLSLLSPPLHPTELIYCFDLDGPGPAFARSDHCDHVHAGFDGDTSTTPVATQP